MSCQELPGAPERCEPGCWDPCYDYFGTGEPCGFYETPQAGRDFITFYAGFVPMVRAGSLSVGHLARVYGGGELDVEQEILEGWAVVDRVFSDSGGDA